MSDLPELPEGIFGPGGSPIMIPLDLGSPGNIPSFLLDAIMEKITGGHKFESVVGLAINASTPGLSMYADNPSLIPVTAQELSEQMQRGIKHIQSGPPMHLFLKNNPANDSLIARLREAPSWDVTAGSRNPLGAMTLAERENFVPMAPWENFQQWFFSYVMRPAEQDDLRLFQLPSFLVVRGLAEYDGTIHATLSMQEGAKITFESANKKKADIRVNPYIDLDHLMGETVIERPSTTLGYLLAAYTELPHGAEKILDLGTGGGYTLACYGALFPDAHLVGVDIRATHIQAAQRHLATANQDFRAAGVPLLSARSKLVQGDLLSAALQQKVRDQGPYDLISCGTTVSIDDIDVYRGMLKPNGIILVQLTSYEVGEGESMLTMYSNEHRDFFNLAEIREYPVKRPRR